MHTTPNQIPKLVIDGVIFGLNPHGGIARWFYELIPRLAAHLPPAQIRLIVPHGASAHSPQHATLSYQHIQPDLETHLRPRSLWFPLTQRLAPRLKALQIPSRAHTLWQSTYYTDVARWHGKKVVSVADLIQVDYPQYYAGAFQDNLRARMQRQIQAADALICISRATANAVKARYAVPDEKIYVTHLGISNKFRRLADVSAPEKPFLLYVGGRGGYKDFETVFRAYRRWQGAGAVDLRVVGADWTAAEQALGMHTQAGVILERNVSDERLILLYNQARAFVSSSLVEGFGLPVLEALACACPVIASDIAATREVANDLPIYYPPADVEGLLHAFEQAAHWTPPQREIGMQHAARFTWDATAHVTLKVYQSLWGDEQPLTSSNVVR